MSADIGQSVRNRIRKRSAVSNIVGDGVFADVLDQGKPIPAIVVQVVANAPEEDLSGTNRIYPSTVVVLAYGRDRDEANELAKQVRDDALPANLSGQIEGMEWDSVTMVSGPTEVVEEPRDGSDQWRRITEQQFIIWNSAL